MTSHTAQKVQAAAAAYSQAQTDDLELLANLAFLQSTGCNNIGIDALQITEGSLVWGGLFDYLARIMREGTRLDGARGATGHKGASKRRTEDAAASITRANRPRAFHGAGSEGRARDDSDTGPWGRQGRRARQGQGVAPTAQATWRQVGCHGNAVGKCRTMRRTDRSTHTATLSSRSRSVGTCAVAHAVPAA